MIVKGGGHKMNVADVLKFRLSRVSNLDDDLVQASIICHDGPWPEQATRLVLIRPSRHSHNGAQAWTDKVRCRASRRMGLSKRG